MSDEVEGEDSTPTNPCDLTPLLEPGSMQLGVLGVVKFLDPEGNMAVQEFSQGITPWEVPGLLQIIEATEAAWYADALDEDD